MRPHFPLIQHSPHKHVLHGRQQMCSAVPAGASVTFPVGVTAGSLVTVSGAPVSIHVSIPASVPVADPQEKIIKHPRVPVQDQQLAGQHRDQPEDQLRGLSLCGHDSFFTAPSVSQKRNEQSFMEAILWL